MKSAEENRRFYEIGKKINQWELRKCIGNLENFDFDEFPKILILLRNFKNFNFLKIFENFDFL